MSNAALWAGFIGLFTPVLVSFITRANWNPWLKFLVAVGVAAVTGIGSAYFDNQFGGVALTQAIGLAITATIGSYEIIWKNTPIAPWVLYNLNGGSETPPV